MDKKAPQLERLCFGNKRPGSARAEEQLLQAMVGSTPTIGVVGWFGGIPFSIHVIYNKLSEGTRK